MQTKKLTHTYIKNIDPPDRRIEIYDELIDNLAVRVTPTGYKTFIYRYGAKGKRYTIGKFPNVGLAEARDIAKDLAADIAKGKDPQEEKKTKRKKKDLPTFGELVEEFKKLHLPTLRESTRKEYERIIDNELLPDLKTIPAKEIEKDRIRELLDKKALKGKSPTMANRIRARLSKIYNFGIGRGWVESNPVEGIPTYKDGNTKRDRFYSKKEIKELWKFFERQKEPTQSVLKMLLITGQRKTETMQMKWSDLNDGIWTIPAELAKNKEPHEVPLSEMALETIQKMREMNEDSDYVFKSPQKENEPISWLTRARVFIQDNSKVPDFRPHDLRRTVATYMAKMKVDRTVLGKILNHKGLAGDTQVTAIYDRHSYTDEKREALEKWSAYLNKILTEKE
ncbi:hypothetical protein CK503_04170 [Aliifodinibius salipaludis]|uniref:Integrase n=1 Tax=Fodinibius salipaludis TaxID=2032627 RepID=A0A2A2GET6_9BACT|nr:site-specific integrase [Aliifodinibius salipaludis]PAU95399.1 hypothetical protein CK503_04170 [Aliifodinibius salipaludis]